MRNACCIVALMLWLVPHSVFALPPIPDSVQRYVPHAAAVGDGILSVAFWDIYQARLIAPQGKWTAKAPYALDITYLTDIEGADIVARTIGEISAQGAASDAQLATWKQQLETFFPDVKAGDHFMGVATQHGETVFYKNNIRIGNVKDKAFSKAFFAIWLGEKTSEPALRHKLLGMK